MALDISFQDSIAIRNAIFVWADSYDMKDWDRLQTVLAPSVSMDYRLLGGEYKEDAKPHEFAATVAGFIGHPRVRSQHLLGAEHWEQLADGQIKIAMQARVAHMQEPAEGSGAAQKLGHGHGMITLTFKKIEGNWKIIGYYPRVDWFEGDLAAVLKVDEDA